MNFNRFILNFKVFSTFRGEVIAKSIDLTKDIATDVPWKVVGDRYRVEHILGNLLSNAIKFSVEGKSISVKVSVDSLSVLDNGQTSALITVKVTDEGIYCLM